MMVLYLSRPHPSYYTLAILAVLSFALGVAYVPWMASFTETVEARNPALTATGLAIWGWIVRVVVFAFLLLPAIISSVNPLVTYGPQVAAYATQYKSELAFATTHATVVANAQKYKTQSAFASSHPTVVANAQKYSVQLANAQKSSPRSWPCCRPTRRCSRSWPGSPTRRRSRPRCRRKPWPRWAAGPRGWPSWSR